MHFDWTISVGNILTIILAFVGVVGFFVRQERMHGANQTRFAVFENTIKHICEDIGEIKDDLKTNRTVIIRNGDHPETPRPTRRN